MPKRKADSVSRPALGPQAARIKRLLEILFSGHQRRMAEETGLSHGLLSEIVNGRKGPGRRVLDAIAGHPKVNPHWLYLGEGEPLLTAHSNEPSGGWSVPIARAILPGPVADHGPM